MSKPEVSTWMVSRKVDDGMSVIDTNNLLIRCIHGFITEDDQSRLTTEHQKEFIDDTLYGVVSCAEMSLRLPFKDSCIVASISMNAYGELIVELDESVRNSTEKDSFWDMLNDETDSSVACFETSLATKFTKPIWIMNELMHPEREYSDTELDMYADRILTMCERDSIKLLVVGDYLSPIIKDWVKQSRSNQYISFTHYHNGYYKIPTSFEVGKLCRYMRQQIKSWNLYYGKYLKPTLDTSLIEDDPIMIEAVMEDVKSLEQKKTVKCIGIYGGVGMIRRNVRRNKELLKKRLRYWSIRDPEFKYDTVTVTYENGRSAIIVTTPV